MYHHQVTISFMLSAILLPTWLEPIQCSTEQFVALNGTRDMWPSIAALKNISKPISRFIKFNRSFFLVTSDDRFYAFGTSSISAFPLLGLGDQVTHVTQPTEVVELSGKKIIKICSSYYHMLALSEKGEVWSWGHNGVGQLGLGSDTDYFRPVQMQDLPTVLDIHCSWYSSYVLTEEREAFAWGYNSEGQLGIDNETDQMKPVKVDLADVVSIAPTSGAHFFVVGLTLNGQVYRWGYEATSNPTLVSLNETTIQITASGQYCFILTESGNIYYIHASTSEVFIASDYRFKSIYANRDPYGSDDTLIGETFDSEVYASRVNEEVFKFQKVNVTRIADAFASLADEIWLPFMVRFED